MTPRTRMYLVLQSNCCAVGEGLSDYLICLVLLRVGFLVPVKMASPRECNTRDMALLLGVLVGRCNEGRSPCVACFGLVVGERICGGGSSVLLSSRGDERIKTRGEK
uniref:Uncharacterized protein n=1 Tax=Aegilops tauschii subsp. strangulata TaxID=200361 RepID=A0A452YPV1_AEGTS